MRDLKFEEVQEVNGGDLADFADGACLAVGTTSLFGWAVPGLNVAKAGCLIWAAIKIS
ncbi:hypothetical protein [Aquimarina aggregata]|uniref:hypothetical protein n=1 Tax=Aquimarina aggregata TaxID=1642818 RepID=UPI000A87463B|nr:hypothetical protein [Aquimarina aggregata]